MVYICSGRDESEPHGRYRHELAFDGKMIYVLGGGTSSESYGFSVSEKTYKILFKKFRVLQLPLHDTYILC